MGSIQIKTAIPGPRTSEAIKAREEAVPRGMSTALPLVIDKAVGSLLTDIDGNRFIDFAAGIGSLNVGHSPEKVVEAMKQQLNHFINPVFNVTIHQPYIKLAQKLNELVPGQFSKKTVFFNGGAEAIENAVKIARRYTGRSGIISFERGFHGRTWMSMSLTSKVKGFKTGFGPMASDIYRSPYPYYYRDERTDEETLSHFEKLFQYEVDPYDIAAIIFEPVQGDGGIIIPSPSFIQGLRKICDEHGIVLIADEVQSGFGRTGKMFAMEHFDVAADITVMSKSIAAGVPLSAVTGRKEVIDYPKVKELGGTLGGNALGCVAALKVIEMIEEQNLLERARSIGEQIKERLHFSSEYIGEVRGVGAMIGVEFVKDKNTKEPYAALADKIVRDCHQRGVITIKAGANGNIIRLLPPLVTTDEELHEALDVIVSVVKNNEKSAQLT